MTDTKNGEFLKLYQPCHDRLGRFVATLVWDREEAKDIVSGTLLVALENFDKLKSPDAFLHFLFGIAIRLVRKRKRRSWRSLFFGDDEWNHLHEKRQTEQSSDAADLHTLINVLGERSREAIVLYEIAGFSIKEISEIQNSSLSAVKSRLARARETLQKACNKEKHPVAFKII